MLLNGLFIEAFFLLPELFALEMSGNTNPSRSKDFAEGSVVTLYYDPEAPEKMYVEGDKSVLGAEALYAGIGVALLVLMFALL